MIIMGRPMAETLHRGIGGSVITPIDPGYDEFRTLWNADIDKRPAAIVQCTSTEDVAAAIGHARVNAVTGPRASGCR